MSEELLTSAEHRVLALLAEAYDLYCSEVVTHGTSRANDVQEFAAQLHVLQHAVMANAAARAYPDLYRLTGGSLRQVIIVNDPCKSCGESLEKCMSRGAGLGDAYCCSACEH